MTFVVGVDLAQREDYTAIAVGEKIRHQPIVPLSGDAAPRKPDLHVRYLRRLRGVSYPSVADFVAEIMAWPALAGAQLIVDATGVGRPVLDIMRERRLSPQALVITGGYEVTQVGGSEVHVPKRELVASVQALLQTGRLKVAEELTEGAALADELGNFAVSISDRGHDSYAAAGSGHDDLVIAVALCAWGFNRGSPDDWGDFYRRTYGSTDPVRRRRRDLAGDRG